jgi:hypothetical protein
LRLVPLDREQLDHAPLILRAERRRPLRPDTHADGRTVDGDDLSALDFGFALTFEVPVLAPGEYRVQLLRQLAPDEDGYGFVPAGLPQPVAIHAGETTEVKLDAPPVHEGCLVGQLLGDVAKARRVQLAFVGAENARREFAVDSDGSFRAESLLPGRYHLAVHSSRLPAVLAPVIEIAPGGEHRHEFRFTARQLTLRLRTPAGEPAVGVFELRCGPLRHGVHLLTGSELTLDPAPELPIEVRYKGWDEWSEAVVMPHDRREHTADVVVRRRR